MSKTKVFNVDAVLSNADWIKKSAWDLPTELDAFVQHLRATNMTVAAFMDLPAATAMPDKLRAQIEAKRKTIQLAKDLDDLRAALGTMESKGIRRVRDVTYWGLPYGTPIVAGMKPQGTAMVSRAIQHLGPQTMPELNTNNSSLAPRRRRVFTPAKDWDRLTELGVDVFDSYTGDEIGDDTLAVLREVMDDIDAQIPGIGKHLSVGILPLFYSNFQQVGGVTRSAIFNSGYIAPNEYEWHAHDYVQKRTTARLKTNFAEAYALREIDNQLSELKAETHPDTDFVWVGLNSKHFDTDPQEPEAIAKWANSYGSRWHSVDLDTRAEADEREYDEIRHLVKLSVVNHEIGHGLHRLAEREIEWQEIEPDLLRRYRRNPVSNYGKTSFREFVAESWNDYSLNENPKPMSILIGEAIIAALNGRMERDAERLNR